MPMRSWCQASAAAIAKRAAMQFARFHPAFQRQMLKDQSLHRHCAGALGEMFVQCSPLLAIEVSQRLLRGGLSGVTPLCRSAVDSSFATGSSGWRQSSPPTPASPGCRADRPELLKSGFARRFICFHAGSGSTERKPSAMERQRRIATRKSCTGSAAKPSLALSHSSRTRAAQWASPAFCLSARRSWQHAKGTYAVIARIWATGVLRVTGSVLSEAECSQINAFSAADGAISLEDFAIAFQTQHRI